MRNHGNDRWDDDVFVFEQVEAGWEDTSTEDDDDLVEPHVHMVEAHEALTKFLNKTNKRSKYLRGMRRGDAWQ